MSKALLGTKKVVQIALLVHDIEKTAKAYAKFLGIEVPEIVVTDGFEKSHTQYQGEDSPATAKLAFIDLGDGLQLELIEPDEHPSVWRDCLNQQGEGFHHIAFQIKDTISKTALLASEGFPTVQTGDYEGGCYTYIDALEPLKLYIETLENF